MVENEKLVGKLIVKLAGRDAGQIGVIVEELKEDCVLIDGGVRRRKCNLKHLEVLAQEADIKKGAAHDDVVSALAKLGVKVIERKPKEKKELTKKEKKVAKKETKKKPAKKK